jgi:hypothetical protein
MIRRTVYEWGSTPEERELDLPCDSLLPDPDVVVHRAIDIDAPPAVVFRWLCQLKVAPYSYDLIDNFGRRSPRELTPGAEHLERGQRVMTIFRLVDFETDRQITLEGRGWLAGGVAVTYAVTPRGNGSRLLARILVRRKRRPLASLYARALPYLDLPMMRKQLLTLKELAERDAETAPLRAAEVPERARRRSRDW